MVLLLVEFEYELKWLLRPNYNSAAWDCQKQSPGEQRVSLVGGALTFPEAMEFKVLSVDRNGTLFKGHGPVKRRSRTGFEQLIAVY